MNRIIALGLTVAGVILIIFGVSASESFTSEVSEALEGTPTNKALWLLVGGCVLTVVGLASLIRKSRQR